MGLPKQFISCDWGTSNFRLRLVATDTLKIISQHTSNQGIKKHFRDFTHQQTQSRTDFYCSYLIKEITSLNGKNPETIPVVASGMLSSSIGMKELPYAQMPMNFNGSTLSSEYLECTGGQPLILVSGVKTDNDVIRGEETQALGLADLLPKTEKGLLILPGTHSKHISFFNSEFRHFKTYMTGELFEIICQNSILATSLEQSEWKPQFEGVFLDGVKRALSADAMSYFFSIRANTLLNEANPIENSFFLSGLLIGSELKSIADKYEPVYLGASGISAELYKRALTYILPKDYLTCISGEDMQKALLVGQLKLLQNHG